MTLTREINRLLIGTLIAFGFIALAAAYWAIIGPDTLLNREDNPRLILAEAAVRRGAIVDRSGAPLAITTVTAGNRALRQYLHPETSSILGYSSLRYGTSGAEAAFNSLLRGDDRPRNLINDLFDEILHRPQVGTDIQLTIDLGVQQTAAQALAGLKGAAVVLAVPSGEVLALVSQPSFDPNRLDETWGQLIQSPDQPFFNRALQGRYQPGGLLQTPLMAAALVTNQSLTREFSGATLPVRIEDIQATCALRLPLLSLTLREAYAFACPLPFARLTDQLGSQAVRQTFDTFRLTSPPVLENFTPDTGLTASALSVIQADTPPHELTAEALGQGSLTVSPLQMALMTAGIVNDGNMPRPFVLLASYDAENQRWETVQATRPTIPIATEMTARQLQDLMRSAVANGAALNAARPDIDIGGHAALAYSGSETQAWFIGFVTLPGQRSISAAVVLENSSDPGLAADIGGEILEAAHYALRLPDTP
jgi:peptidoglycan glycosyltransferase